MFLPVVVAGATKASAWPQLDDHRRDILGQSVLQRRIVGDMHFGDAGDLRRLLGDAADIGASDDGMDLAQLPSRGDRRQGGVLELAAFMLNPDERNHPTTPIVFSLSISSSTEPTLTPASRFEGSATLSVWSRGAVSTP